MEKSFLLSAIIHLQFKTFYLLRGEAMFYTELILASGTEILDEKMFRTSNRRRT